MNAPALMPANPDRGRWTAVLARDRARDGEFVYAVTSTGIFCRPSCPSRRPRKERVRFFDTAAAAAVAGFRPCLRCRPLEPARDPWLDRVASACRRLADAAVPLSRLAAEAGCTRHHFLRNFTRMVGVTPRAFAEARRFEAVRTRLRTAADVTSAFYDAGFGSSSRFYERAAPKLGMRPGTYRAGGTGETIRFACAVTPFGRVLVAATPIGVCQVALGDTDAELVRALRAEYPEATVAGPAADLQPWLARVLAHLDGRTPRLELPLDIRATAFQWQVWNALRAIPRGQTRTYAQVAEAIGQQGAARAVARACATNPVAVAVPCHRVVPAQGGTGGYRWGSGRKATLLAAERDQDG